MVDDAQEDLGNGNQGTNNLGRPRIANDAERQFDFLVVVVVVVDDDVSVVVAAARYLRLQRTDREAPRRAYTKLDSTSKL
jgi:hypothetical protein